MLMPAFIVHIHSTSGTVIDMDSGFLPANRAIHRLPPIAILSFLSIIIN